MKEKIPELSELWKQIQEHKMQQKEILNLTEAAEYIGIAKSYLYKLTSKNIIPYYRPNGKLIFFRRTELEAWLTRKRNKSMEEIDNETNKYLLQNDSRNGK